MKLTKLISSHVLTALLLILFYAACKQSPKADDKALFIDYVNAVTDTAGQKYRSDTTGLRNYVQTQLHRYTSTRLKKGFSKWQAQVEQINTMPLGFDGLEGIFKITDSANNRSNSVLLTTYINHTHSRMITALERLKPGDKVLISGVFDYNGQGLELENNGMGAIDTTFLQQPVIATEVMGIEMIKASNKNSVTKPK